MQIIIKKKEFSLIFEDLKCQFRYIIEAAQRLSE